MEQNQSNYAEYATLQSKIIYASFSPANAKDAISFLGLITNFHRANVDQNRCCVCQRQRTVEAGGFCVVPRQIERVGALMAVDILNGQSRNTWVRCINICRLCCELNFDHFLTRLYINLNINNVGTLEKADTKLFD